MGQLQLDVVRFALGTECGVPTQLELLPYCRARWLIANPETVESVPWGWETLLAVDTEGQRVGLFDSSWLLRYCQERYSQVEYQSSSGGLLVDAC